MRLQNSPAFNKDRIAYLTALTLLLSYAEMLLPRIIPFFRLGLGNVIILLAFDLSPLSFLILTVVKSVASCLMSGTLFSPFFIISLVQSVVSGFAMYLVFHLFKKTRLISVYGISIFGSAVSAVLQIVLCSLYLGSGTMALLGPMLLFSLASGIITAFLSRVFNIPETAPLLETSVESQKKSALKIVLLILLLVFVIFIFAVSNLYVLIFTLVLSFVFQLMSKRKIMLLPHLSLWLFVIVSTLFMPEGKVLFKILNWNVTEGALFLGIKKAIKLSSCAALSQCLVVICPRGKGIVSRSLQYFGAMSNLFRKTEGNLITKFKVTLQTEQF